jgi:predicted nucleic acid-binding protein
MRYVLDSSVAVKWVLKEILTDKALLLRDDFKYQIHELLSPDVFPIEVSHALTKAERKKVITPPQGGTLWMDIMKTCPLLSASIPLVPRAYQIASKAKIGIYDCLYVALAELEKCELVTADDKLIKNLQAKFPSIRHLSTFP